MPSSGMLRRVALVITDVSEELSASIIRVTKIDELGTTLAVTSNQCTLRRNTKKRIRNDEEYEEIQNTKSLYFFVACVGC
jgi:hypothetical protein